MHRPDDSRSSSSPPRSPSLGSRLELEIDSLAFGGEGVARHEGLVVLVEEALPGDRVLARLVHCSSNFARARVERVLSPAPGRIPARCRHFHECGGCAYQNLEYSAQLAAKRRQVLDLLERIGGFPDPPVPPTVASPHPFQYRSRMTYALQGGEQPAFGLHRRASPGAVMEVEDCLLPENSLQAAYQDMRNDLMKLSPSVQPLQIEVVQGDPGELPVAVLHGRGSPGKEFLRLAGAWTESKGPLGGVIWKTKTGGVRRARRGAARVLSGGGHVFRRLGPYRFRVPAHCFFQANSALADLLFSEVARRCAADPDGVLELYCGVGALSLYLGGAGSRVLAVEGDAEAVRAAVLNSRENGVPGVDFRVEKVEEALRRLEHAGRRFGTVVADPPGSGLPRGTARLLGRLAGGRILYLSCNPSTLARDLKEIVSERTWRLVEVIPLDMFPQTAEIECLAELRAVTTTQEERSRSSPVRMAS